MKLCSDDVVFSSVLALIETQGYGSTNLVYFDQGIGFHGLQKIDSNAKLQQLKRQHKDAKLLNLSIFKGSTPVIEDENKQLLPYQEPIVYDLSEPPLFAVDEQGIVFESQGSSRNVLLTEESKNVVGTQESKNAKNHKGKGKLKQVVEEDSTDASSFDSEGPRDIENDPYFMGEYRPKGNEGRGKGERVIKPNLFP